MQNGVLVIDKPVGPSSFDVVRRVRWAAARRAGVAVRRIKAGHGGTLDPMASGVLPICLGEATKLAPFLLDADKAYEAEIQFGVITDTLDATGVVLETRPLGPDLEEKVRAALAGFVGRVEQVPPMYSALKHQGKPLYAYARAGQEITRQARPVHIHALEPLAFTVEGRLRARIRCSKGTYVRSLAADLGERVGAGAHLMALRRTASGPYRLDQAVALGALLADAGVWPLVSLSDVLAHLPAVTPDAEVARAFCQGRPFELAAFGLTAEAQGALRVLRADGALLAVAEVSPASLEGAAGAGMVRPVRVFHPEAQASENEPSGAKTETTEVDFGPPLVGKFNPV